MFKLVVVAVILIVIMIVFTFILFKNLIKRMDENAKKYFVNKMQDYDYILEEKQEKLEEIKTVLVELQEKNQNILQNEPEVVIEKKSVPKEVKKTKRKKEEVIIEKAPDIQIDLNVPQYREVQFFQNYKAVRQLFTVDNEKIIKQFIEEHKNESEENEYKQLKALKEKFDEDTIYGCVTLSKEDQIKVLEDSLTDSEKKLVNLDELIKKEKFNIRDLIEYIDKRSDQIEPIIYIYVSMEDNNYASLSENIVVKLYKNMSEGIIIKFRDKIYDYSI